MRLAKVLQLPENHVAARQSVTPDTAAGTKTKPSAGKRAGWLRVRESEEDMLETKLQSGEIVAINTEAIDYVSVRPDGSDLRVFVRFRPEPLEIHEDSCEDFRRAFARTGLHSTSVEDMLADHLDIIEHRFDDLAEEVRSLNTREW